MKFKSHPYKSDLLTLTSEDLKRIADGETLKVSALVIELEKEPKPDVIALGIIEWNGTKTGGMAQYNTEFRVSERYEKDNVKLTFDGETGKLKSAEVL